MRTVTNDIKQALKQPTTTRKGEIIVNNTAIPVYNVEYYADCYDEGKVIGNVIAAQLSFDMEYTGEIDEFQYRDYVKVGNVFKHIDMGTFKVFDEQDQDTFEKHIVAFDKIINFNAPYVERITYPCTMQDLYEDICDQAGVIPIQVSLANGSFIIENSQFEENITLKTALKYVASINGVFGSVKDDKLKLSLGTDTNEVISKSEHEPVDWKRRTYGINQVILGDENVEGEYVVMQDDEDIALNGVHKLVINNNPFAYNQTKRSQLIQPLFNQVKGFGYIPYEMGTEWLPYLEIGDRITIDETETIVLRINAKSPNALESTMSAPALIDNAIDYLDNTETIDNRLRKTEVSVDKANQTIGLLVEETGEFDNRLSNLTVTVDGINSKVESNYNFIRENTANNIITIDDMQADGLLALKITGELTNNTQDPNIYLSISDNDPNLVKLPMFELHKLNDEIYDEFNIEAIYNDELEAYELHMYLITRVDYYENQAHEITADHNYLLAQDSEILLTEDDEELLLEQFPETRTDYGIIDIPISKGQHSFRVVGFDSLDYYIKYAIINEISDEFALKKRLVSEINQSAEGVQIRGDLISLEGRQIDMTAENINITSNNFNVDEEGNMTCNDATMNNATMNNATINNGIIDITSPNGDTTSIGATSGIVLEDNSLSHLGFYFKSYLHSNGMTLYDDTSNYAKLVIDPDDIRMTNPNNVTDTIIQLHRGNGDIKCVSLTQTSKEEEKKNFKKLENALDIVKNVDIYEYNFKFEKDKDKKHIGFVIGDNYKYRKEITSENNDGVDTYSMVSVLWKAVQEQQEQIQELKNEINKLKGGK